MNEAETCAEHVGLALKVAGWGVVAGSRVLREHGVTLGRLQGSGGKGARAGATSPTMCWSIAIPSQRDRGQGLGQAADGSAGQARRYAAKLAVRHTYVTNGQGIYGIDMATGAEGEVALYPSPDALWQLSFPDASPWRDRFAAVPFEDRGGSWQGRYYRDVAIARVLQAIEAGRDRILLRLATGTGKTRRCCA